MERPVNLNLTGIKKWAMWYFTITVGLSQEMLKICKRCFREFDKEIQDAHINHAMELADIMLQDLGTDDINDLCPQCQGEFGVMNLLGFGL